MCCLVVVQPIDPFFRSGRVSWRSANGHPEDVCAQNRPASKLHRTVQEYAVFVQRLMRVDSFFAAGVAVACNSKITVALFVDVADGQEFAKLLAREVMESFTLVRDPRSCDLPSFALCFPLQTYAAEIEEKMSSPDTFASFNGKLLEVISNSVRPVLDTCEQCTIRIAGCGQLPSLSLTRTFTLHSARPTRHQAGAAGERHGQPQALDGRGGQALGHRQPLGAARRRHRHQ